MPRFKKYDEEIILLSELRKGSEKAFETLFGIYKDKLYAFSYKILKSKDLADDVVIEVFTKIWEKRESIKPSLSFQAYLFKVAKNHIINSLHKAAIAAKIQQQLATFSTSHRSSTEEEVIYNEYLTLAEKEIDNMPPQRSRVFKLRKDQGMSYDQIAAQLGVSKNTVKSHLAAATAHLRSIFVANPDKLAVFILLSYEVIFSLFS